MANLRKLTRLAVALLAAPASALAIAGMLRLIWWLSGCNWDPEMTAMLIGMLALIPTIGAIVWVIDP